MGPGRFLEFLFPLQGHPAGLCRETPAGRTGRGIRVRSKAIRMTQDIYWELLIWLFRSFMGVTAFAFTVAAYQAMRCRKRTDRKRKR